MMRYQSSCVHWLCQTRRVLCTSTSLAIVSCWEEPLRQARDNLACACTASAPNTDTLNMDVCWRFRISSFRATAVLLFTRSADDASKWSSHPLKTATMWPKWNGSKTSERRVHKICQNCSRYTTRCTSCLWLGTASYQAFRRTRSWKSMAWARYQLPMKTFKQMVSHRSLLSHPILLPLKSNPPYFPLDNGPAWHWFVLSILPLENDFQYKFLTKTSLKERLKQMKKIISILLRPFDRGSSSMPSSLSNSTNNLASQPEEVQAQSSSARSSPNPQTWLPANRVGYLLNEFFEWSPIPTEAALLEARDSPSSSTRLSPSRLRNIRNYQSAVARNQIMVSRALSVFVLLFAIMIPFIIAVVFKKLYSFFFV